MAAKPIGGSKLGWYFIVGGVGGLAGAAMIAFGTVTPIGTATTYLDDCRIYSYYAWTTDPILKSLPGSGECLSWAWIFMAGAVAVVGSSLVMLAAGLWTLYEGKKKEAESRRSRRHESFNRPG